MATDNAEKQKTLKILNFIKDHWGEVYTVFDLVRGILGKRSAEVPENAPPEVKIRAGLFGSGDEIKFVRAMLEMDEADQDILVGLIAYHFGDAASPRSWVKAAIAFAQMNKFRSLVTDLDVPSQKVGDSTKVTTVKNAGAQPADQTTTEETTTKESIFKGQVENTKAFLKHLAAIVRKGESASKKKGTKGKREDGYKAAITYMHSLGVPLMPSRETMRRIEEIVPDSFDKLKGTVESFNTWVDTRAQQNQQREAALPKWRQLVRKLIS